MWLLPTGYPFPGPPTPDMKPARPGYPGVMTTPEKDQREQDERTSHPVPTEQSDTPVDETPDGDGVHLDAQPVADDDPRTAAS